MDESNVSNVSNRYTNADGKFKPGNPGKPKGASVKAVAEVREIIKDFLEKNMNNLQENYDLIKSPTKKLKFITDLLPYVCSKLASIQIEQNQTLDAGIRIFWQDPPPFPIRQCESAEPVVPCDDEEQTPDS